MPTFGSTEWQIALLAARWCGGGAGGGGVWLVQIIIMCGLSVFDG